MLVNLKTIFPDFIQHFRTKYSDQIMQAQDVPGVGISDGEIIAF